MDRVRADALLGNLRAENDRQRARLFLIEKETAEIAGKKILIVDDQEDCQSTIKSCEKEILTLRKTLSQTDEQNKTVQEQLDDLRNEIGNLRISVGSIEESLRGAIELSDRIQKEKSGYADGLVKRQNERELSRQEVISLIREEEEKSMQRDALKVRELEITSGIKALQLEKEELEQELSGFIDRLSSAASRL